VVNIVPAFATKQFCSTFFSSTMSRRWYALAHDKTPPSHQPGLDNNDRGRGREDNQVTPRLPDVPTQLGALAYTYQYKGPRTHVHRAIAAIAATNVDAYEW
jgi:hypothetical protein